MSYVPANDGRDLAALLGGLIAMAVALVWWVRRGDAVAEPPAEGDSSQSLLDAEGHWVGPQGC